MWSLEESSFECGAVVAPVVVSVATRLPALTLRVLSSLCDGGQCWVRSLVLLLRVLAVSRCRARRPSSVARHLDFVVVLRRSGIQRVGFVEDARWDGFGCWFRIPVAIVLTKKFFMDSRFRGNFGVLLHSVAVA